MGFGGGLVFFLSDLVCVIVVKKWAVDSVLMVLDLHTEPKEAVLSSCSHRITRVVRDP